MELLNGSNQYRCEPCAALVDARKGIRIGALPPILTLALNRFNFDWDRNVRVKETGSYAFPLELDMTPYCVDPPAECKYKLYSVVIHSGAAHGGHYHAYIRDFYGEGVWSAPPNDKKEPKRDDDESKKTQPKTLPPPPDPLPLLMKIVMELSQENGSPPLVDAVLEKFKAITGRTWNIAYSKTLGRIGKYLDAHQDIFALKGMMVRLQDSAVAKATELVIASQSTEAAPEAEEEHAAGTGTETKAETADVSEGMAALDLGGDGAWFDLNDNRVSCIRASAIEKQFAGKESAYMLFYARVDAIGRIVKPVLHEHLQQYCKECNAVLQALRFMRDLEQNSIPIDIHLGPLYHNEVGLVTDTKEAVVKRLVDLRSPVSKFLDDLAAIPQVTELGCPTLHVAKVLPEGGLQLMEKLEFDALDAPMSSTALKSKMAIFVWDGETVDGLAPRIDPAAQLIAMRLTDGRYPDQPERTIYAFRDETLVDFKRRVGALLDIDATAVGLMRADKSSWKSNTGEAFDAKKDARTLHELGIASGVHFVAVALERKEEDGADARQVAPKDAKDVVKKIMDSVTVLVKFRLRTTLPAPIPVTIDSNKTVGELREAVCAATGVDPADTRLTLHRSNELKLLVHEDATLKKEKIENNTALGIETGRRPNADEIYLTYRQSQEDDTNLRDIILPLSSTVAEAQSKMLSEASLEGEFHLCKANWCGEVGATLSDPAATLASLKLDHNDMLLLDRGRLVPKGFIRFTVYADVGSVTPELRAKFSVPIPEAPSERVIVKANDLKDPLVSIATLELPQTTKLAELLNIIVATPPFVDASLDPSLLQVREVLGGRMGRAFTDLTYSIQKCKFAADLPAAISFLSAPSRLTDTSLLLGVGVRDPLARNIQRFHTCVFEGGTEPHLNKLVDVLAAEFSLDPADMCVAKYFKSHRKWLELEQAPTVTATGKRRGKKKGPANAQMNLLNAPISLKSGDVLAVKLKSQDPKELDDFSLEDEGTAELVVVGTNKEKKPRKPEPRLEIHVPVFQ